MDLEKLETSIEYKFKDINLLKKALTHTSYAHENNIASNEKLEFLGDAILEFIMSEYLYKNYTKLVEGEMTKVRATVVCENSLYNVAQKHNFSDFLYLGKSEIISNGRQKPAILADSIEAVIAAILLDSNMEEVKKFVITNLKDAVELASQNVGMKDYKTVLQEELQKNGSVEISYEILEEKGPDHDKIFVAQVSCNNKKLAIGQGNTKKHAEMEAAKNALSKR